MKEEWSDRKTDMIFFKIANANEYKCKCTYTNISIQKIHISLERLFPTFQFSPLYRIQDDQVKWPGLNGEDSKCHAQPARF